MRWWKSFEAACMITNVDYEQRVLMLQVYLNGFARTVFERFLSQTNNRALKDSEKYKELFEAVKTQMYGEFMQHEPVKFFMSQLRSLKKKYDKPVREYNKRQQEIIINLARHGYEVSPVELTSFEQGLLEPALKHLRQTIVKATTVKEALSTMEAFEEANPTYNKKPSFTEQIFFLERT